MSADVVKYAFIAGEISPTLFGRTDLTKYDLAVAEGKNFFVDYRGGLSTRPGFEFCDLVKHDDQATKFFSFAFSPDLSNTYLVLFGHQYIRFVQDGAYVLSDPIAVSGVVSGVATSASHGLSTGTWGKLGSRTVKVGTTTTDTFQVLDPLTSAVLVINSGATSFAPIYEVASPYTAADLAGLTSQQYRDLLRLTHLDHPVRSLIRNDHDDWVLAEEDFTPNIIGPDISSGTGTAPDPDTDPPQKNAQTIFTVTMVNADGDESVNGNLYLLENIVNYTVYEGSVTVNWTAIPEAVRYNVYRSIVASEATLLDGSQLGYVGSTKGTSFTDGNITPDFSHSPPIKNDPFAPGRIKDIQVTAGGTGYTKFATSVTITDPDGSGFEGDAVIDASGAVVNVIVKNPGSGYTAPVVVFSGGTGATATATVAPLTGTYPALSAIFQQRQTYAASREQPITVWGSRYKRFSNFDTTELVVDNDSYEFDLDTAAISPIRHVLVTRGGMLLFTQLNIWLLNGGGQGEPLTPTNALAEPQTYTGVTSLPPLPIDSDVLYREGKGYAVRLLSYSEASRVYGGEDKSILANHLFGAGQDIVAWAYQESPFKVVWCAREDGALLAFTIVKPEDVFAWTPGSTRGKFLDVISIREGSADRVYVMTQRKINGRYTKFIERMSLRDFINVEDAWCVDAGLSLEPTYPAGTIVISNADGVWQAASSTALFSGADVGKYLRAANGIFKVIAATSQQLSLTMYEKPQNFIPESGEVETWPFAAGEWSLDQGVTSLTGLWHLEGETVSILGDGNVFPQQVVTNGTITLSQPVTRCIVGLGFTCRAKSLPIVVPDAGIESRRKRIVGLGLRLDRTRGLKNGRSLDSLYEMRERTTEPMGRPTRLINGVMYQMIASAWDPEGQTYFEVTDPLPATILSLVFDMEVGDDPD